MAVIEDPRVQDSLINTQAMIIALLTVAPTWPPRLAKEPPCRAGERPRS